MRRVFVLGFIWGWSFLFIRVVVQGASPFFVAAGRIAIGAAVVHAVAAKRGLRVPRDRSTRLNLLVLAVFYAVAPFSLIAWGETRISSALASVLNASTPMFTAAFAVILLHDRLAPGQVAGLVVALVGVAVLSGAGSADLARASWTGVVALLVATAMYGFSFVWVRRHLRHLHPIVITAGQLRYASMISVPIAAVAVARHGVALTPVRVLCLLLLGVFGTGGGYLLNYRTIAELGATTASLVTFVVPVVAVTVGVVVLGDTFSVRLVTGGAVVLAGIGLVQWRALRSIFR